MTETKLDIVILGLTVTSTWGNGHATTYRGLIKELAKAGHRVTFLERDMPWYASNREFTRLPYCDLKLYSSIEELRNLYASLIRESDLVVTGSYVPDGIVAGEWVTRTAKGVRAFYDIDTPITLSNLAAGKCEYLSRSLVSRYDLYLSFTGGPTLDFIEKDLGSPAARALYCSVDPDLYFPEPLLKTADIGYLGTYAADRQPALEELLFKTAATEPTRSFVVAGPQYPESISWPANVQHIDHLPASGHRAFYNSQRFALNLTRQDMVRTGYSPSVRLFEAAACSAAILTDLWPGLDSIFATGSEVLAVRKSEDAVRFLKMTPEERELIGMRARARTLQFHTAAVRSRQLVEYVVATFEDLARSNRRSRLQVGEPRAVAVL